jgi:16S rRNA (cytidine1402-2'-O)-methyltransferase
MSVRIEFQGHADIRAEDPQLLEILESEEWTRRAAAIGYRARYRPEELLALRGRVRIEIHVGALHDVLEATLASTYHRGLPLVIRRDTLVRAKPLAWQSSKTAADLDRAMIEALRQRDAHGYLELTPLGTTEMDAGTLVLVAMPIGNQADLSPRAIDVLSSVDLILAEDTRVAEENLRWRGIRTPVLSCYDQNERSRVPAVRERLMRGGRLALISDAGTPLVSDPGYLIVQAAREVGAHLQAIPGPSAVLLSLMLAALPVSSFHFRGFAPRKANERERFVAELLAAPETTVLFEATSRIADLLQLLAQQAAERQIVVCRDLTKRSECLFYGTAASVVHEVSQTDERGEYTLVVAGAPRAEMPSAQGPGDAFIKALLRAGSPSAPIVQALREIEGLSRQEAYRRLLALKGDITAADDESRADE